LWGPAVLFGLILVFLKEKKFNPLSIPVAMIVGIVVVHAALYTLGMSTEEAKNSGLLFNFNFTKEMWQPLDPSLLKNVDWLAMIENFEEIIVITIVTTLSLMLSVSSSELIVQKEANLDKELKMTGLANIVSGIFGGMLAFLIPDYVSLNKIMKTKSRFPGIITILVTVLMLFFGMQIIIFLPTQIVAGLLFFLGVTFLIEMVYKSWFQLPKVEFSAVVIILCLIVARGFIYGVLLGILMAIVIFVVRYSRAGAIKHARTGKHHKSNVERHDTHRQIIKTRAEELNVLKLHGSIFFGTAVAISEEIKKIVLEADKATQKVHTLVLDFSLVMGFDSSAVTAFIKLKHFARDHNFKILMSGISSEVETMLINGECLEKNDEVYSIFTTLDYAIEHFEIQILNEHEAGDNTSANLIEFLRNIFPTKKMATEFSSYWKEKNFKANKVIFQKDDKPKGLYFLKKGSVNISLSTIYEKDLRLSSIKAGALFGEDDLYYPKNECFATAIAKVDSELYFLPASVLKKLDKQNPQMAHYLHGFIIKNLARHLRIANQKIRVLAV
jgi:sulfate permease, SulP family